jgi:hypothetical protein
MTSSSDVRLALEQAGKFTIFEEIAEGANAVAAFRAFDGLLQREVFLKVMYYSPEVSSDLLHEPRVLVQATQSIPRLGLGGNWGLRNGFILGLTTDPGDRNTSGTRRNLTSDFEPYYFPGYEDCSYRSLGWLIGCMDSDANDDSFAGRRRSYHFCRSFDSAVRRCACCKLYPRSPCGEGRFHGGPQI